MMFWNLSFKIIIFLELWYIFFHVALNVKKHLIFKWNQDYKSFFQQSHFGPNFFSSLLDFKIQIYVLLQ